MDNMGESNPLSANSSPLIRKIQYIIKNPILSAILMANPPLLAIMPRGAPIRINTMLANGIENFLWSSTKYLLIEFLYELISAKSLSIPLSRFFNRRVIRDKDALSFTTIESSRKFDIIIEDDIINIDKYGDWYNIVSPKLHIKSRLFNKYI